MNRKYLMFGFGVSFIGVAVLLIWRAYLNELQNKVLSVSEVRANADFLDNKKIKVGGYANLAMWITAVKCCPPYCGCNESLGVLHLSDEKAQGSVSDFSYFLSIEQNFCSGNDCTVICDPIDLYELDQLRLTGRLDVGYRSGEIIVLSRCRLGSCFKIN